MTRTSVTTSVMYVKAKMTELNGNFLNLCFSIMCDLYNSVLTCMTG